MFCKTFGNISFWTLDNEKLGTYGCLFGVDKKLQDFIITNKHQFEMGVCLFYVLSNCCLMGRM